jgi:hypothetical protein
MRRICALAVAAAVVVAACGSGTGSAPAGTLSAPPSAAVAASASQAAAPATPKPTPKPLPTALARPNDLPLGGTCDLNHTCLGLLEPGKHHTEVIMPGFSFSVTRSGWENLEQAGGVFDLTSITAPGDVILFAGRPRATSPDGVAVSGIESSVASLGAWLSTNPALTVSPATPITIGGLKGQWWDITASPDVQHRPTDCPAQVCVLFLRGRDPSSKPTWQWDIAVASSERLRLYLLDWKDDVVAILVDSLDGTTFDALTAEADKILGSVAFDKD